VKQCSLCGRYLLNLSVGGTSEPLSVDTLNELFFLHERGTQAGVQGIWLSFGASFAPVISGFLIKAKGWRWFHWLTAILSGTNMIMIFFCLPETQYPRDLRKAMDVAVAEDVIEHAPQGSTKTEADISEVERASVVKLTTTAERNTQRKYTKKTYLQDIKPWSPVNKDDSLIGAFIRPWALWAYASVAWTCLSFSIHVSAYVTFLSLEELIKLIRSQDTSCSSPFSLLCLRLRRTTFQKVLKGFSTLHLPSATLSVPSSAADSTTLSVVVQPERITVSSSPR
jgi:MFS family permease